MTTDQEFWLAVLTQVSPWVVGLIGLATLYLKLAHVEKRIDGRMTELIQATGQAAHAEGKVEGLKEAPIPPVAIVVPQVSPSPPRDPGARTRRTDPPPDEDPTSHLR